jgi:hypothetical protein
MSDTKQDTGNAKVASALTPAERIGLTHGDEYKMLREEIMLRIKATHQTELFGAIGVGLVYSWLITHKDKMPSSIWWLGPVVVALCGISNWVNVFEMKRIGAYLAQIEDVAFAQDGKLTGWEHRQRIQSLAVNLHLALSVGIWVLGLVATIWATLILRGS